MYGTIWRNGRVAGSPDDLMRAGYELATVSIPGTHDTCTYTFGAGTVSRCQELTLTEQLLQGIRFVDIRLVAAGSDFARAGVDALQEGRVLRPDGPRGVGGTPSASLPVLQASLPVLPADSAGYSWSRPSRRRTLADGGATRTGTNRAAGSGTS
jgi:hypothetical protein